MRIERINDNQIRCTLNKRDLAERHLKISELAYGSDKAKKLFRDMMEQAHMDYGFEADDIPLMIEAIPTSRDSIVLVITKVDNPEELEERFSPFRNFSRAEDDDEFYDSDTEDYDDEDDDSAFDDEEDDEEFDNDLFHSFEQLHEILEGESTKKDDNDDKSDFVPLHEMLKKDKKVQPAKKKTRDYAYSFSAFSLMANASCAVYPLYQGESCVWKDEKNKTFYLVLSKPEMPDSMRHICSILNEFGTKEFYTQARKEYFKEHYSLFIPSGAIEKLSKL